MTMTPEQQHDLQRHLDAIAKILYENTPPEDLTTLGDIEQAVRKQAQLHVLPRLGFFLSELLQARRQDTNEP